MARSWRSPSLPLCPSPPFFSCLFLLLQAERGGLAEEARQLRDRRIHDAKASQLTRLLALEVQVGTRGSMGQGGR